jgi:hypothetical protein
METRIAASGSAKIDINGIIIAVCWQLLSTHTLDTDRWVGFQLFIALASCAWAGGTFAKYLRESFDGFFGTVPFSAEYLILASDIYC